jgi:hypothetical protein
VSHRVFKLLPQDVVTKARRLLDHEAPGRAGEVERRDERRGGRRAGRGERREERGKRR